MKKQELLTYYTICIAMYLVVIAQFSMKYESNLENDTWLRGMIGLVISDTLIIVGISVLAFKIIQKDKLRFVTQKMKQRLHLGVLVTILGAAAIAVTNASLQWDSDNLLSFAKDLPITIFPFAGVMFLVFLRKFSLLSS